MSIEKVEGMLASAESLVVYIRDLLAAIGLEKESAKATSRALVDASSRGVDTHGVRLAPWYAAMIEGGRINAAPKVTFTRKAPSVGHIDADDGFGHLPSFRAIDEGCAIAASAGVAAITVGRSMHHGATGVYTLHAAHKGFAAIGMTHADPAVVPFGGVKPFFGTNPISFAVPAPGEEPMLLDMATSAIPYNRVHLRRITGTPLPPDVAIDADGAVTRDPHAATALLPLGGSGFGYKGAGLSGMIDVLCSAFTGMVHGARLSPFGGPDMKKPIRIGHFFLVLHPEAFQALGAFDDRIGAFLADLRAQPAKLGAAVMAPGDLEKVEAARRRREGVPVDRATWDALTALAKRHDVAIPEATQTSTGEP